MTIKELILALQAIVEADGGEDDSIVFLEPGDDAVFEIATVEHDGEIVVILGRNS